MNAPDSNLAGARDLLRAMVGGAKDLNEAAGGSVADAVSVWLAPQYLMAAREKLAVSGTDGRFEVLQAVLRDWSLLRRGDHAAARLQLDRERFDWQRANSQARKEEAFAAWLQRPEIQAKHFPERTGGISATTLAKIEQALNLL